MSIGKRSPGLPPPPQSHQHLHGAFVFVGSIPVVHYSHRHLSSASDCQPLTSGFRAPSFQKPESDLTHCHGRIPAAGVGIMAPLLPNCPQYESRMQEGPRPFRRIFGDIRAFECLACDYILIRKHPFQPHRVEARRSRVSRSRKRRNAEYNVPF
jgi:hypothetical protein